MVAAAAAADIDRYGCVKIAYKAGIDAKNCAWRGERARVFVMTTAPCTPPERTVQRHRRPAHIYAPAEASTALAPVSLMVCLLVYACGTDTCTRQNIVSRRWPARNCGGTPKVDSAIGFMEIIIIIESIYACVHDGWLAG